MIVFEAYIVTPDHDDEKWENPQIYKLENLIVASSDEAAEQQALWQAARLERFAAQDARNLSVELHRVFAFEIPS